MSRLIIRKVAVLGAGVMGAQIAAHCANAGVPVVLFDLPAKEGDPSGIARKAIDGLKKLDPAPLATKDRAQFIDAANYGSDLEQLRGCDLIVEAIAEKLEWKLDLYAKVAPYIRPDAIFASNTSGLSIAALDAGLPDANRTWLTTGAQIKLDKASTVDLGAAYIQVSESHIDNRQASLGRGDVKGVYDARVWILGAQYSMAF